MGYKLEGRMLELCDCNVICPCWVGRDPDNGTCKGTIAWHFDAGEIDGIDVSGLTIAVAADIPGNVLDGQWRVVVFMDEAASEEQERAILSVYTGEKGGPVGDLVQVIGEVAAVRRARIEFSTEEGEGVVRIGDSILAEIEVLTGATGKKTTMQDTVFSTIPGAPAYVSESRRYRVNAPEIGIDLDIKGRSAVSGPFAFAA